MPKPARVDRKGTCCNIDESPANPFVPPFEKGGPGGISAAGREEGKFLTILSGLSLKRENNNSLQRSVFGRRIT